MKVFLLLVAITAYAAPSSVRIANPLTSSITSVKTLVWGFKKGDIAHYPRPVGMSAWQTDQVRRWSDGSVKIAIISFTVSLNSSESRLIDFVDDPNAASAGAGMTSQQMLDRSWDAAAKLTYNGAIVSASARTTPSSDTRD